jgi:L-rhamnose mutarotase
MFRKRVSGAAAALVLGVVLLAGCASQKQVQRQGAVIALPKENIAEYKKLHAETWPGVLKMIDKAHIHNYSIYLGEVAPDQYYLFAYDEYTGSNLQADMARMKKDKVTQDWWKHTDPLQKPLPTRKEGEWWAQWEEVFHHDGPAYQPSQVKSRHGSIIGMAQKNILAYTQMHAAVWPGVLAAIDRANIRNYSIYLGQIKPGEYLLFSYFEYIGDDFQADMKGIADKVTKTWWTYTDPLQTRLPGTPEGEQWKPMEEVFHTD